MKNYLFIFSLLFGVSFTFSQTTLFSEDFESGSAAWTLNGGTGLNSWAVNNIYDGEPVLFGIPNTPDQPSGVTGAPRSNYLHIKSDLMCGTFSVCNAIFETGSNSNQNATMTNSFSTLGMTNVTLSFYYLCNGASGMSYGTLEYSTDNGIMWNSVQTYSGVSTWTLETQSLPAWDNQANLKFRFNWQNGSGGSDPAFSIDEILVTGQSTPTTTVDNVSPSENIDGWCYNKGGTFNLNFDANGPFDVANMFTAELSDANGSFANPVAIGTLNSTNNGTLTIVCNIPTNTPVGSGYRVRVTSSGPSIVSADNGTDFSIFALPNVSAGSDTTICEGDSITLSGSGADSYVWDNSVHDGLPFVPSLGTNVYTVLGYHENGCAASDSIVVVVEVCEEEEEEEEEEETSLEVYGLSDNIVIYPNPVSDYFNIEGGKNIQLVKITDLNGRVIKTLTPGVNNKYSLNGIAKGTYFVDILMDNYVVKKQILKK